MTIADKPTNRLIDETSPYLVQHAHNPVEWYPWGDEAFEKARAEDKPVLVSIGYSACHWCHVMERESFEDEATARIQNEHFINIKVDMEERPDVDQIYMTFVQMTTGRGGWPMNVFVTPDKRPFFGGTYFPPRPQYGMPSWQQVLLGLADAYRSRRDELELSATEMVGELRRMSINTETAALDPQMLETARASFQKAFDEVNGGFGGAPKFPPAMALEFLLRYHQRTGDERALAIVTHTLNRMAQGGIYDQLGGGFHRYSVDAERLVPHFEKMLYDNAQLVRIYLHAYQTLNHSGNGEAAKRAEAYRSIVIDILEYVRREMLDAGGGFYSTQDADSEGEEGRFFVWTDEEIEAVFGPDGAAEFMQLYGVTAAGNFEGRSILNRNHRNARPEMHFVPHITEMRERLFSVRETRVKPHRDEKVLTAWNGLMLAAFADAAGALGRDDYLAIAERNAEFLLAELQEKGRLLRTWKDGRARLNGYVEDYANLADGLLTLYAASGKTRYFAEAVGLADVMIEQFWDEETGGFFFTSNDHEELVVRNKDYFDNATPSGNSVAADVLLRLHRYTGDERYYRHAVATLRLAAGQIRRHPQGFGRALSAMEFCLGETREVVVAGTRGDEVTTSVLSRYLPFAVVAVSAEPAADAAVVPLFEGKTLVDGKAAVYICRDRVCERPLSDAGSVEKELKNP